MKHCVFDPEKDKINQAKHGISLADAERFDWDSGSYAPDRRKDYGEARIIGTGYIDNRLYILVFTVRDGIYRIISLRKANPKERAHYEKETANH